MAKYVISSNVFDTKKEAIEQLEEYLDFGTLDENAKVYEIKKTFKVKLELEEEKGEQNEDQQK